MKQSLLIFSAIPFSAIGGIWALYFRGMPFSISAGIGFIALFGVAVLNGIVLIGEFNRLKKEGLTDLKEIILQGTAVRLRPVLMTATVASLGFLPMALSHGSGAEVQKPLATVVIGGLLSATLLTLIVLPILYTWFENGMKVKPLAKSSLIGLLLIASISTPSLAQQQPLTMEYCIQQALSNNGSMKSAEFVIAQNKELRKTSFDLSKTNVTGMYGQYNSYRNDLNVTVSQNISFPTVYMNLSDLAKANIESSEIRKDVIQNELVYNVKQTWYQLLFIAHKKTFLEDQDSIFERYAKAAAARYRAGEINVLEKITIESQLAEIKNKLFQNQADLDITLSRMSTLLNNKGAPLYFGDSLLTKKVLNLSPQDSNSYASNPALMFMKQQIAVNETQKSVERSRLMPDFNFGYFNQSLRGFQDNDQQVTSYYNASNRFQGVMVGVSIPIWARSQAARVKAADYSVKAAEANYELMQRNLNGQYNQLLQEYLKYNSSLVYYEKNVLPQTDLILSNAYKTYVAGEINYIEYITAINTALTIRTDYLNLLNQYNQAVINIEFIIGNN